MRSGQVCTSDGVRLHYFEDGAGPPVLLVHGWSQSGAMFHRQIDYLKRSFRAVALEFRGHGRSERPDFGYNVARLSKDLYDGLVQLDLRDCVLVGHSMGCAVIWSYIELFGFERLSKLILVDQSPAMVSRPHWSLQEREDAGCVLEMRQLYEICDGIRAPFRSLGYIETMLTSRSAAVDRTWLSEENLLFPRRFAADLFHELCMGDWRKLISRINIPTLVIGGRVSSTPWRSQEWIHKTIPGSAMKIFEGEEGGGHLMFIENPDLFNRTIGDFIAG